MMYKYAVFLFYLCHSILMLSTQSLKSLNQSADYRSIFVFLCVCTVLFSEVELSLMQSS